MIKLMEPELRLVVLERDKAEVKKMIKECEEEYAKRMKEETNNERICILQVEEGKSLEPQDIGGVSLITSDGKIVCKNTFAAKLKLVYDEMLPVIRNTIFPSAKP